MSCAGNDRHVSWRKSSYSIANGDCVETATRPGEIMLRDSRNPAGALLRCSPDAWRVLLAALKSVDDPLQGGVRTS
jgi:hypothetical protein